ncbi:MAG: radical SAM protein [Deltaproteobacteria bacterium]|jgi:KamA family protein|nr:radical SAM protein [Deltaproteobacteria bacterium]
MNISIFGGAHLKETDTGVEETVYHVKFVNSGETSQVALSELLTAAMDFLAHFGGPYLVGKEFHGIVGDGDGETKFKRLLQATGYRNNPEGFFAEITEMLARSTSTDPVPMRVGNITLPNLLVLAMLEKILPGNQFVSIRDVRQYEKLANVSIPEDQRNALQEVMDTYPVRLSKHTLRQMRISKNITYQYAPFVEELDPVGQTNTWIGQFHQGLLEQMYRNRVIFLLNMSCPVYCRFCFRKHKESRNQTNPTRADVQKAIGHIEQSPAVKEIVLTGGDPFLNKTNMMYAIDGLKDIPHVQTLRLATRSISYYPHLFYDNHAFWLNYLKMKNLELQQAGKRLEVATHFIHPDEISLDSLEIISELVKNGIAVYVQTPFLEGCNDEGPELTKLFSLLRGAGAELHYIYIPCSPIHGNSVYWSPLSKGLEVSKYLRAHLSDRVIPRICTATPIGKIDWHSSGWAVEKDALDDHFVWIRTPYTQEYFKAFAERMDQFDNVRVNSEGTLDARFMAQIGDENLFIGSREARPAKTEATDHHALKDLQAISLGDQRNGCAMVSTPSKKISRVHETRVELDATAGSQELDYIRKDDRITDVVFSSKQDSMENLYQIEALVRRIGDIHHVNAVRLRSFKFNYHPEIYTRGAIDLLGSLNRLTMANPMRLEIETQFLHSSEIKPIHEKLVRTLNNKGITVYSNTPLLATVNDTADKIHSLAFGLRHIGVEFHHIYVAGGALQKDWNAKHPVDLQEIIDIATRVRRDGSGREIPRYVVLTDLGEVDFGLTSRISVDSGQMRLALLPYTLDYYQSMDPEFELPKHVTIDDDGHPVVPVSGLVNTTDFIMA